MEHEEEHREGADEQATGAEQEIEDLEPGQDESDDVQGGLKTRHFQEP
jgi:predicted secreted Zn-dependent protease